MRILHWRAIARPPSHLGMQAAPAHLLTVGVLGGMGPAATVDFLAKLVRATPARSDQEHVPAVVWNVPQTPDRSAAILNGDDGPLPFLLDGLAVLEQAGADFIAMPCNSAHHWHASLQSRARVMVLHIADAAAAAARRMAGKGPVAVFATQGAIMAGIYQERLARTADIMLPDPGTQALVDEAILTVKAGGDGGPALAGALGAVLGRGAASVLLGCTELPIAAQGSEFSGRCIDATQALAEACIAMSYSARRSAPSRAGRQA